MRADRLLSILMYLQVKRQLTTRELAQKLEVSERTIHRDMEALSAIGVPVVAERGINGGWHLLENYSTNLTGLSETEIQALFLTQPPTSLLTELGLQQSFQAALLKLLAALPAVSRQGAEYARQRIYIDIAGWSRSQENIAFLPIIQEAIWQEKKVRFLYKRGEGSAERIADPLGLVAKGNAWYLVAVVEGDIRSYRVSRILDATLMAEPAIRPTGFDLASFWHQSTQDFKARLPRYFTTVRVHPDMLYRLKQTGKHAQLEQLGEPDEEGWTTFSLQFDVEHVACEYILGYGPSIEVLEPTSLRTMVINMVEQTATFYHERDAKKYPQQACNVDEGITYIHT